LFFCDSAQQTLLAQHPSRQPLPIVPLETGHTEAGSRTALVKSASNINAVNVSRFTRMENIAHVSLQSNPDSFPMKPCQHPSLMTQWRLAYTAGSVL